MDLPFTSNVTNLFESVRRDSAQENEQCNSALRYINQVLMEEDDWENRPFMIQDSTLDAAEKSLSELLNQKYPSFPNQHLPHEDTSSSSDDSFTKSFSDCTKNHVSAFYSAEFDQISNLHQYNSPSIKDTFLTNPNLSLTPTFCDTMSNFATGDGGILDFEKNKSKLQPCESKERILEAVEKDEGDFQESLVRGRKSHHREESDLEGEMRSKKHFANSPHESVLHEMFAKVSISYDGNEANEENMGSQQSESAKGTNVDFAYTRKGATKRKAVDMRSLLIQCMQSVANNDHRSANNLLNQIRLRSSPSGTGSQRLAHYFAKSLEARLLGTASARLQNKLLCAMSLSNADVLRGHKLCLSSFPFMETSYFFSAQSIMDLAQKADTIHIIHFGIVYGLQWPPLIQRLSTRPGGPPKLRITGIDLPGAGLWPGYRVKETGRRLANYCKRFSVPFEYNGFEQNWETLCVEDFGIKKGEVLVVNCAFLLMYLFDDTLMEHSPRDAVLNLIRRINPDMFIHGIVNATHNSPFFISRFKEALFHFSALFDMFEATVPWENEERMVFEREIWGNEILGIVACEGLERVQRPETYKQWQIRTQRAGFRQLPLSQDIMKTVKSKVKNCYHKDFFVDEASNWLLEGWRGRVFFALSCWKPT